jgi:hypothetical protein
MVEQGVAMQEQHPELAALVEAVRIFVSIE